MSKDTKIDPAVTEKLQQSDSGDALVNELKLEFNELKAFFLDELKEKKTVLSAPLLDGDAEKLARIFEETALDFQNYLGNQADKNMYKRLLSGYVKEALKRFESEREVK